MRKAGGLNQANRAFSNWRHNAIVLNFPNGNSISTVWGYGSITKQGIDISQGVDGFRQFMENDQCEVMFNCGKKLHDEIHSEFDSDGSIIGYLSITDWLAIVNRLASEIKEIDASS